MAVTGGFFTLFGVFGLYKPSNHRCVTQVESYFDYADIMKLLADPNDPKCRHFPVDIDAYNDCVENDSSSNVTECVQQTRADKSVTCEDYAFDDELVTGSGLYSASMQYGLFCEKEIISTIIASLTFVAFFIGAFLSGIVSDRFGRVKTTFVSTLTGSLLSLLLRLMPTWWSFLIVWFFMQGSFHIAYIAASVYIVEVIGPSKRHYGQITSVGFGIGYMLSSPLAYGFPDWRNLSSAGGVMGIVTCGILLTLPTSPRWLYSRQFNDQGRKVLEHFAVKTKSELPDNFEKDIVTNSDETAQNEKVMTLLDVIRCPPLRRIAIIMGYVFLAVTVAYYGLSYNAAALPGSLFVNNAINGAVETLAYVVLTAAMPFVGRKKLTSATFVMGGAVCIACGIMLEFADGRQSMLNAVQWLSFVGKFFISGTFGVIFVYVAELYPTEVRSVGTGMGSMAARIGGVGAPYVLLLGEKQVWLPLVTFGTLTIVGGIVSLMLPETLNRPIPQTIAETMKKKEEETSPRSSL